MTKLVKIVSSIVLLLLISGCANLNVGTPIKPKIDDTLEMVDNESIKSISDITSIALEWKKVEDPRVVGYNIYRANMHKDGRKLKLIKSLNSRYTNHFLNEDLEPSTKYVYQISTKSKDGLESRTTNAYMVQTANRPDPISFVQAISNLPNRIKLIWRPHENLKIKYYKVQKLDLVSNKWTTLKTLQGRLNAEYIDTGLDNNETFKYRVVAYTFEDIETLPSDIVSATTKPLPIGVQDLIVTKDQPKKIVLTWQPSPTTDVINYRIYRSSIKTFGFTKYKEFTTNTLEFTDYINEDGKVYYYKVLSVDRDLLESSSKVEPVKGMTLNKPAKPIMTLAQIQGNKAILNWVAGDNRAISYNVYKKAHINFFESKTEKFTDIKDLRFEDNDIVNGIRYTYSIQSNDEYGLISEQTSEAELILPKINK